MRILYLTHGYMDYLADEVLYGLRSLLGREVVDYPKKDILYASAKETVPPSLVWANGSTAFGLQEIDVDRDDIDGKIRNGYFDLVVNSNCWRIHSPLHEKLVVLDGQDHHLLNPTYLGRAIAYFKRELLWNVPRVEPIQFAMPDHLLENATLQKTQLTHASFAVYPGLRQELCDCYGCRHIDDWREYMNDIRRSWFGISPKGAGYDCQRHYEILGNAVLCIYLDQGAPRILKEQFVDGINCLTFDSLASLKRKIDGCGDPQGLIDRGRQSLLEHHLSSRRAKQVLERVFALRDLRPRYHFLSSVRYGYLPYYSGEIVRRTRAKISRH